MDPTPSTPQASADAAQSFTPRNATKADIYVLQTTPPVLVKDYRRRGLLVRLYGRFCLHNEERALRRLAGVKGVPAFHSRPGPYALAMEFVEARPLAELRKAGGIPPEFGERLAQLFAAIESRGVAHGDPHFRNILCDQEGQPYLIDFSFSYVRGTLPWIGDWVFRNLQVMRQRKLEKLRRRFYGETDVVETQPGLAYRVVQSLGRLFRRRRKKRRG